MARKIVTSHQFPPIPIRSMDWLAYFDGQEEGPQGWGPTEEAAIADLIENLDDEDYAEYRAACEREAEALHYGGLSEFGNALMELDTALSTAESGK